MEQSPVTLIVGGGRGMGAATARLLAARGHRLALMSPSGSAEALAGELGGAGLTAAAEDAGSVEVLATMALERWGRIDGAVILSGHPPKGDLLSITDEDWDRGNRMMMTPLIRLSRAVTPAMEAQGKGSIVAITTFAAFEPSLIFPVSCAYRAAVGAFVKLYSDRYAAAGIRMNALLPGYVDSLNHKPGTADLVPMKRLGRADEIATTVAFLLSEDAGYITGQNLRVDGGLTRHV